ncbi:MAG TPA: cob(I)yrinic acid a,c-diamide adenosyltransferase [Candidatus Omnitrophota bacterium]|nr:cob(I)yrinic acid a,c-diamide adenosyltransferase [Candidatus Omnitrophota bacterium]HPB68298.1 cob(I)yrinic acid a,c-diamide adenosyltransferase [Candidatus Omnitrophota bacterium]HQO57592.1 cob(I)yrinic acid a,c-diamide adenosyltransferase [Candidatus Omnitrophota bacterium]HQP12704.1 cob(I)yrinic acid a,c-diamide adenosyltransferase [Candidatus Omnitrophota bacterium]
MPKKGLIQIYTGNGKGKTTAAIGLAVRARSHGHKVCYVYFHKNPEKWGYTEHHLLQQIGVDVFGFAKASLLCDKGVSKQELRQECLKGLEFLRAVFQKNRYDLLILDEINISLRDGFLMPDEIIGILSSRPARLEIVLTGRGVPREIIEMADLVSDIHELKHPYKNGVPRRIGIEY